MKILTRDISLTLILKILLLLMLWWLCVKDNKPTLKSPNEWLLNQSSLNAKPITEVAHDPR